MQDIIPQLEEMLDRPTGSLTGQELLSDIPEWDSVMVLGVISLSDALGGRELSPEDFKNAKTINDIISLLRKNEA